MGVEGRKESLWRDRGCPRGVSSSPTLKGGLGFGERDTFTVTEGRCGHHFSFLFFYQGIEMFASAFQFTLQNCFFLPSVALYHVHGILISPFASNLEQLILMLQYVE